MIICNDCKKEMTCSYTGTRVRFGERGDHVYAGDTFECPTCHKKTTVCNKAPHNDNIVVLNTHDVLMDKITDTSKIKKKKINLRRTEDERPTDGRGTVQDSQDYFERAGYDWEQMCAIIQKISKDGWYVGNYTDDRPDEG